MATPCNSLNVQLIKVSNLATYNSLKDVDQLMIVENTDGNKYSRKSELSELKSYILDSGISGYTSNLFNTVVDGNTLNYYSSGASLTFSHGFSNVPSLVRVVLKCNSNDGLFSINQEVDINTCFNGYVQPVCTIISDLSKVLLAVPAYSTITMYDYNSVTNVVSQYGISPSKWNFKIYAWK